MEVRNAVTTTTPSSSHGKLNGSGNCVNSTCCSPIVHPMAVPVIGKGNTGWLKNGEFGVASEKCRVALVHTQSSFGENGSRKPREAM